MLKSGILNPALYSLLARVRHTNLLVIADRGFPYWPQLEIVDISLVDDIPTVPQVLAAVLGNFQTGAAWMAEEFLANEDHSVRAMRRLLGPVPLHFEPHGLLKQRVPGAIGLIRTADTTPYANIILESA